MTICIFTIYAFTTPVPPMKAKLKKIVSKSDAPKPAATKSSPSSTKSVGSFANFINSNAITKNMPKKKNVIKAQILVNKQPMLCFVQEVGKIPMIKGLIIRKKRVQASRDKKSVLSLQENGKCCGSKASV